MTYSNCTDGEFFHGEFETAEDAAVDAFNENEELKSVEVGENHKSPASFYVAPGNILDEIAQFASEECGEIADGWLEGLVRDKAKKAELKKLVGDWIEANEPPTFWRVENTRTITRAEMVAAGQLKEIS